MNASLPDLSLQDHLDLVEASARIAKLPAIATQDWCDRAADELLGVRRAAAVTVTIANLPHNSDNPFSVEATGGASGQAIVSPETLGRIHSDTARDLGWAFETNDPNPHNAPRIRAARLHELPSRSAWPVTTPGKRWSRIGITELLVLQASLHDDNPSRVLAVELGATRDQPVFGRKEALAATALMSVLRERARLAFGSRETSSMSRVTKREQEILEQLTLGKTVREIAQSLNRSPHTVHDHVKSLHRKLDASSRGELISRFLGYISADGSRVEQPHHTADVRVARIGVGSTQPAGPAAPRQASPIIR